MPPEHGVIRYDDYGCRRCQVCRAANAERHRQLRAIRAARHPEDSPELEHGTKSTYMNHGCRCERCSEAHEANRRPPKQGHARQLTPADECATVSGYFRALRARRYTLA